MDLKSRLKELKIIGFNDINKTQTIKELDSIRIKFFGKKGLITEILHEMKNIDAKNRPIIGSLANNVRDYLKDMIDQRKIYLNNKQINSMLDDEKIDVTLPGNFINVGNSHILRQVINEIENLFLGLGFEIINGSEIEEEHYNFEMLNLPKDHPARDMQDTFYINSDFLMRTQTSPVQSRTLEIHDFGKGPLKMISPGKVYRRDTDDATHSHQFNQIEGLVVDKNITMSDLKGILNLIVKNFFGSEYKMRLRPSYFPFTEPSAEVDISCFKCNGHGCSICKYSGWIEVLGAGMVHPKVLDMAGVDSSKYGGFAFGLGPDRFAMLKYGIDDIRKFYLNDLRFLSQFSEKL